MNFLSSFCLSIAVTLFLEWVSVLVVATTTSNRSILLTQIFWSFPLPVFYRSSAEHPHKTSSEYVCLKLHVFISKNLQQFYSSFTLAGWIPGALPCQGANCDSVRHFLFSMFAANLRIWRPFPYPQPGDPMDGCYHHHTINCWFQCWKNSNCFVWPV